TDPSLSGCSDIASLLWDGDPLPDLAVANRTGDSVTVLLSSGGVQTMPTGKAPRRLEGTGDYDGDGRVDLVVANEGDGSDSGNPDVTLLSNPNPPVARVHIQLDSETPLMGLFDLDIPAAQALVIPEEEDRFWLLDSTRRFLSETDSNGNERRNVEFPFEVGGIHFTDEEEGYVLEQGSSRLHRFEIDEEGGEPDLELELVSNFLFSPGEIGFSGLAYDEDQKEFFVSVPGIGKILRLDEEGDLVAEIEVDIPAWDLAWDGDRKRLLAVNPGRSDMRAYTRSGTLDVALTEDFADSFGLFGSIGIAGISWSENENRTYLVTTSGTLFDGSNRMVDSPLSTSPASEVLAMDYSANRDELYLLNRGGFFFRLEGEGFQDVDLFSAWPALVSSPSFIPAGIAFDETSDEILIVD
ncbi:MAG: hypothetical protein KC931_25355, partial [Candidatus Omnitrophica bacterium]|nr:hypothetical protein [Candidatus Omnitrophota bacterium]